MAKKVSKTKKFERYIGQIGAVKLEGMTFEVIINDFKQTYGRNRFLIAPRNGKGEKWSENVRLVKA
jgi:hypothetical protein